MKIQFHKEEESRANKLYLVVNYYGGDADTDHPKEYEYKHIKFHEWELYKEEIEADVENYRKLKTALKLDSYGEMLDEWGEEIADLYETVPNDPQNDYQFKCSLDGVILRGYDENGTMYETYNLLR